jgi:hypothetical protein
MRAATVAVATVVGVSLGCGGLFVDGAALQQVETALSVASPDLRLPFFYQGGAEAGLVNPLCADMLSIVANASAEMRSQMLANALFEAPACPRPCADGDTLAPLEPGARTAAAVTMCGGDDPFGGELAPLRDRSDALDYLMSRLLLERAEAQSATFAELRDELAVSLALGGPRGVAQSSALQVDGTREVPELVGERLASALATCDAPVLDHRLVLAPDGKVVGVAGASCGADVLEGMPFAGDGTWTVVDLAWEKPVH